jgi:membrane-associated phospholipid phosphatase
MRAVRLWLTYGTFLYAADSAEAIPHGGEVRGTEDDLLTTEQSPLLRALVRQQYSAAITARYIFYGLLVCLVLCAVSVTFLDRPIALFVHDLLREQDGPSRDAINALALVPDVHIILAIALVATLGLVRLKRRGLRYAMSRRLKPLAETDLMDVGFLASMAVIVAEVIKTTFKFAFGRTWPETWIKDNPSFIRDGVYGFFPFHGGVGWASFPSGHMTAVSASMTVLWLLWPRWRAAYALIAAAAGLGLLGMDYHFLADILAGAYLGWAVGVATVWIGRTRSVR